MTDAREVEVQTVRHGQQVNPKKAKEDKEGKKAKKELVLSEEDVATILTHASTNSVKVARTAAKADKNFWAGRQEVGKRMSALSEDGKPWLVRQTNAVLNTTIGRTVVISLGAAVTGLVGYWAYGDYKASKDL